MLFTIPAIFWRGKLWLREMMGGVCFLVFFRLGLHALHFLVALYIGNELDRTYLLILQNCDGFENVTFNRLAE